MGTGRAPVGPLELFYDLVFVASTMVLSNAFTRDLRWGWAGLCALLFALLWLLWFQTTVLMNVARAYDLTQRILVFAQMFLIFLVALAFVARETSTRDLVGAGYMAAVLVVAFAHHRVGRRPDEFGPVVARWAIRRRNRLILSGLALLTAVLVPGSLDWIAYATGIAILALPVSFGRRQFELPEIDAHHLVERAAVLTLIMFGEAFVKVALVVSGGGALVSTDVVAIAVIFAVLFSLYSIYFDDVPDAGIGDGFDRAERWLLAHLPIQIGIVAVAVGLSRFLSVEIHELNDSAVVILLAACVGIFSGLMAVGVLGRRRPHRPLALMRLATMAVTVPVAVVVWWFDAFRPVVFVIFVAVLFAGHAVLAAVLRDRTVVGVIR